MKHRAARILASLLALLLLAACAEQSPGPAPADGQAPAKSPPASEDASGTGEHVLTVSCPLFWNKNSASFYSTFRRSVEHHLTSALGESCPDLEIQYYDPTGGDETMDYKTAMERMNADIMAGKGPDVIIGSTDYDRVAKSDICKQAGAGAFADLSPYIEQDEAVASLDSEILSAAKTGEAQYILPLYYRLFVHMTCNDVLDACGLRRSDFSGSADQTVAALLRFMDGAAPRSILYAAETGNAPKALLAFLWPEPEALSAGMDTPLFASVMELLRLDREKNSGLWADAQWETYSFQGGNATMMTNAQEMEARGMVEGRIPIAIGALTLGNISSYALALDPMGGVELLPMANASGGATARVTYYGVIRASSSKKDLAYAYIQAFSRAAAVDQKFRLEFPLDSSLLSAAYQASISSAAQGGTLELEMYYGRLPWFDEWLERQAESAKGSALEKYGYSTPPESMPLEKPASLEEQLTGYNSRINGVFFSYLPYELVSEAFEPYLNGEATYDSCLAEAKFQLELYLSE